MAIASQTLKRFYATVEVTPLETGFGVHLDGRALRTPARAPLALPSCRLAEAVAAEWQRQGDTLDIAGMHLTRLANVALDRTPAARQAMVEEAARYAATDTTCYLAEAPGTLVARQQAAWEPVRAWAARALGVALVPTAGIVPVAQPGPALEAVRRHAGALDDFGLTGLVYACGLYGSALLALAVAHGWMDADAALDAASLEETFQAEAWGDDDEALIARAARRLETRAVGAWFDALA